jgi:hypothetical protein
MLAWARVLGRGAVTGACLMTAADLLIDPASTRVLNF